VAGSWVLLEVIRLVDSFTSAYQWMRNNILLYNDMYRTITGYDMIMIPTNTRRGCGIGSAAGIRNSKLHTPLPDVTLYSGVILYMLLSILK
jgi:hypothetical protein